MSELALIHLRQARSFARSGDQARAVELLEKARVLARDDVEIKSQVLRQLAEGYDAVGNFDRATRCREQLHSLNPAPANSPASNMPAMYPVSQPRTSPMVYILASALVLLIVGGGIGVIVWSRQSQKAVAQHTDGPNTPAGQNPTAAATPGAATRPAKLRHTSWEDGPVFPVTHTSAGKQDRQQMLRNTVGLCVIILRYEGPVGSTTGHIDLPLGTGTAFAISTSGVMLTNRHIVDAANEMNVPVSLEQAHLPTMTLRGVSYVVCFGPNTSDRFVAQVLHKSERYDLAILKIDHRFASPLTVAAKELRQGDDILVCGYPGAVMDALNQASNTPSHIIDISQKWQINHHIDAFDGFSPDSFNSTLTKGIVSAPERNVQGAGYMQIDAAISPGNSGGPVLNLENEVVGIATFGLRAPTSGGGAGANYNFALLMQQLHSDIQPYASQQGPDRN